MSDQSPAIAGVQKCGCITYVNSQPDRLTRDDEIALGKVVRNGGTIRRATVEELRRDPNFLNVECPHDPKGWEREIWKPTARCESASYRNRSRKRVKVQVSSAGWRVPAGEIVKGGGKWWATTGYFDSEPGADGHPTARDFSLDGSPPIEPLGPFDKKKDAKQALVDLAVKEYEARQAEAKRLREAKATA